MKRSCDGCKALEHFSGSFKGRFVLGHPIEQSKVLYGIPLSYKPLEECEKPTTFKKLAELNLGRTN